MTRLLCSTGGITRHPEYPDYRPILVHGPRLHADGLELMVYPGWYANIERIGVDLLRSGLTFPVLHVDKSIGGDLGGGSHAERKEGIKKLELNCRLARSVEAALLVLHLWDLPGSDERIEYNLDALPFCLDVAERMGLTLAVETIPCTRADPLTNLARALQRDARCLAALDTEFLAMHDQLETAMEAGWLWNDGRVRHVHVKDYDGCMRGPDGKRRYLHPGDGQIDFDRFFSRLSRYRFDGSVSLEVSGMRANGHVDVDRLNGSLARVAQSMVASRTTNAVDL